MTKWVRPPFPAAWTSTAFSPPIAVSTRLARICPSVDQLMFEVGGSGTSPDRSLGRITRNPLPSVSVIVQLRNAAAMIWLAGRSVTTVTATELTVASLPPPSDGGSTRESNNRSGERSTTSGPVTLGATAATGTAVMLAASGAIAAAPLAPSTRRRLNNLAMGPPPAPVPSGYDVVSRRRLRLAVRSRDRRRDRRDDRRPRQAGQRLADEADDERVQAHLLVIGRGDVGVLADGRAAGAVSEEDEPPAGSLGDRPEGVLGGVVGGRGGDRVDGDAARLGELDRRRVRLVELPLDVRRGVADEEHELGGARRIAPGRLAERRGERLVDRLGRVATAVGDDVGQRALERLQVAGEVERRGDEGVTLVTEQGHAEADVG